MLLTVETVRDRGRVVGGTDARYIPLGPVYRCNAARLVLGYNRAAESIRFEQFQAPCLAGLASACKFVFLAEHAQRFTRSFKPLRGAL